MAKNKMKDLRDHLFETIEALKDEDKPMDIERAKAISGVAQTLIETAKVELKFLDLTGPSNRRAISSLRLNPTGSCRPHPN